MKTEFVLCDIDVTEDDIATGKRKGCLDCPIVKALKKVSRTETIIVVQDTSVEVILKSTDGRILGYEVVYLSYEVITFIANFDNSSASKPPKPFKFQILLPTWALKEDQK